MTYIGVDISKAKFTAAFPQPKGYKVREFDNTPHGVHQYIKALPEDSMTVMEATGNYCFLLLYMLDGTGHKASLLNPKQTKGYARMTMSVTKTDAQDAQLIAEYARRMTPREYKLPSTAILSLRQKRTVLHQMKKQRTANSNLLEAIGVLPYADKDCVRMLRANLTHLDRQIDALERDIAGVAETEFSRLIALLTSVKGIGMAMATTLIVATAGFTMFSNARQFSRHVGLCPSISLSGSSVKCNGHISRDGDGDVRSCLYLAALSASRHNATCHEAYLRMRAAGKPAKLALIAVANKLVRQSFAVVRSGSGYVDGFVSQPPACVKSAAAGETPLDQGGRRAAGGRVAPPTQERTQAVC